MTINPKKSMNLRDGEPHIVGPIRLQYQTNWTGTGDAQCRIQTEVGTIYLFDFPILEVIALGLLHLPDPNLFTATESDKDKHTGHGFLRLRASQDKERFGALAASGSNEVYQLARIVANAGASSEPERVVPISDPRDYRRANLRKEEWWGRGDTNTRRDFIEKGICDRLSKLSPPSEVEHIRNDLSGRFVLADVELGFPEDTVSSLSDWEQ